VVVLSIRVLDVKSIADIWFTSTCSLELLFSETVFLNFDFRLSYLWDFHLTRAQICKPFKEPRNQFPSLRAGIKTLFDVPARQATWAGRIDSLDSISWLLECTILLSAKAGSLKMNTALEHSTRVVQEGDRRCKKSTLNDLVHLTPLRIPLMNPPLVSNYPRLWYTQKE
jgi:hypothetical protein